MSPLISVLVLVFDIAAISDILQHDATASWKLIWIFVVLIFPFLGMILYFAIGTKQTAN